MYKVIIVDDEINVFNALRNGCNWEDYGFDIIATVTDSQKAVEIINTEKPDVLFTDIEMPNMNGLDLIKTVKKDYPNMKIVIISAYDKFEYAQKAISYGIVEYCLKPIKRDIIENVLLKLKTMLDTENSVYDEIDLTTNIRNTQFKKLVKYVDENYCEKLYLNELAKQFDLNVTYCCLLFNKHFGCTFMDYVAKHKMAEAAKLLKETDMSVYEIADYLSYDYFYFTKIFKKHYGVTPRQYKNNE